MTAVEGLRDIARKEPEAVLPILEEAKDDDNLYVKKSVANVLRNAPRYELNLVFELCQKWALLGNPNTNWIFKDDIKKLSTEATKRDSVYHQKTLIKRRVYRKVGKQVLRTVSGGNKGRELSLLIALSHRWGI